MARKVDDIETYIGLPYTKRGRSREEGFDCWGLMIDLIKRVHDYDFPDPEYDLKSEKEIADAILEYDKSELANQVKIENIQYGDIVMISNFTLKTAYHFGMYIGDGRVIHGMGFGTEVLPLKRLKPYITGVYRPKPTTKSTS